MQVRLRSGATTAEVRKCQGPQDLQGLRPHTVQGYRHGDLCAHKLNYLRSPLGLDRVFQGGRLSFGELRSCNTKYLTAGRLGILGVTMVQIA